jgi:hypothetical protein
MPRTPRSRRRRAAIAAAGCAPSRSSSSRACCSASSGVREREGGIVGTAELPAPLRDTGRPCDPATPGCMTANTACKGETGVRPPLEKNLRAATCVTILPLGSPEQMTPWARRTSRVWGSRPFEDGHAGGFPVETGYSHQRRDRGSRRTGRPGARSLPVARERSTRRTPVRIEASSPP